MALSKGKEIPTIDCSLVTMTVGGDTPTELAIDTASKVAVEVLTEKTDAQKLIIKNQLKAQRAEQVTVTGNKIVLTDNLFIPQVVLTLQGGTITKDPETNEITGYTPPVTGSTDKGEIFELSCYSAIYNAAGICTGYEKITYPNCQGTPVSMGAEDNVFRVSEYTIVSMPDIGQAPYAITYVKTLPAVANYTPAP